MKYYTSARNAQIILYLLRANGIRKVIASPGTQNMSLVTSMQHDPYFEMYSAPDERSAAYMACGLAAESGEPVVLSCTGATASRNYVPGLTEAFYRHLPVVAITSTERVNKVGQNIAQIIDRSTMQSDIAKVSVRACAVDTDDDAWECMLQVNKALLAIHHHGTGPVHINLEKVDDIDFSVRELPPCRVIRRYTAEDNEWPELPQGKVCVFIGAHKSFTQEEKRLLDSFCAQHGSVVFCDHTSGYHGKYAVHASLVASQDWYASPIFSADVLITMGEISGDYYQTGKLSRLCKEVWRVNEDGELRDQMKKLTNVFEMRDITFLKHYVSDESKEQKDAYLVECTEESKFAHSLVPDLPFCNIWMALQIAHRLPTGSCIHFGILNSLRAYNFQELPEGVTSSCNVGGFGIDGGLSTLLGASLANKDKLYFGVFGDLAFFYDMNSLGNRHVGNNLRIMLVNNAKGSEFKLYSHPASRLGEEADAFIAASGHYGKMSPDLVKHYAQDLGFEYLTASTKEEFLQQANRFLEPKMTAKPMLFEVFTEAQAESDALKTLNSMMKSKENQRKDMIKKIIGENAAHALGKLLRR